MKFLGSMMRDHLTIIEAGNITRKIDNRIFGATGKYTLPFGIGLDFEEIAWENSIAIADFQGVAFDFRANYRWKDSNGRDDRYATVGGRMKQTIDAFNWTFDYLHDLTRGLIRLQDTTKDRFTLDLNYSPKLPYIKGSFGVNLDYEMNGSGDITKEYDRFTSTAVARIAF